MFLYLNIWTIVLDDTIRNVFVMGKWLTVDLSFVNSHFEAWISKTLTSGMKALFT